MDRLRKIFLVDDDEADNEFHRIVLEEAGFRGAVECHLYAEDALERLRAPGAEPPDLILLDINMPRMSGFDFIEELEGLKEVGARPVVAMLSTSRSPQDRERARGLPRISGFLNKPLREEELYSLLNQHFPRQNQAR